MHLPSGDIRNNTTTTTSYSPSFNSYFNADLTQIAARVSCEFTQLGDSDLIQWPEEFPFTSSNHNTTEDRIQILDSNRRSGPDDDGGEDDDDDEESEFEFDLANLLPANGEIGPVYPVFNRDLLQRESAGDQAVLQPDETSKAQIQLETLFIGEDHRHDLPGSPSSSSSSDSEAEELESVQPGTYCVWTPNTLPPASPGGRCTKSSSTGSGTASSSEAAVAVKTKAWKLRDLLRRSKSDGKEGVMLITPASSSKQRKAEPESEKEKEKGSNGTGGRNSSGGGAATVMRKAVAAREGYQYYYARRARQGENSNFRRRSYLPYKQDLVGFFVSPQGLRRMHLPPF